MARIFSIRSYNDDDSELVTAQYKKHVYIWNTKTGECKQIISFPTDIHHVAWNHEILLAADGENTCHGYNMQSHTFYKFFMPNTSPVNLHQFYQQTTDKTYRIQPDGNDVMLGIKDEHLCSLHRARKNSAHDHTLLKKLLNSQTVKKLPEIKNNRMELHIKRTIEALEQKK